MSTHAISRWLGIVVAVVVAGGWWSVTEHGEASVSTPDHRKVAVTYVARVPKIPSGAVDVHMWVPLGSDHREQKILRRRVQAPGPYTIVEDAEFGNEILHLRLTPPLPDSLEITIDYEALLLSSAVQQTGPATAEDIQRYLESRGLVIVDEAVRMMAQEATAERATLLERARALYDQVIRHMVYDKQVAGWGRGDTRRACLLGKGNCTDFHSLFISLARAERIPARFKVGFVVPEGNAGVISGYHCWAEFYLEGRGWLPVDASEAWKHPERAEFYFTSLAADRFLVSVGRDIRLVPDGPGRTVNIFFNPYVEVDGEEFSDVETEISFRDLKAEGTT